MACFDTLKAKLCSTNYVMPILRTHSFADPPSEERSDLTRRAKVAWFSGDEHGAPDDTSGYLNFNGLGYVVLRQRGTVLAVYRVRNDNLMLRRMKRPPKGIGGNQVRLSGYSTLAHENDLHPPLHPDRAESKKPD